VRVAPRLLEADQQQRTIAGAHRIHHPWRTRWRLSQICGWRRMLPALAAQANSRIFNQGFDTVKLDYKLTY
jgi:hypothetical protein